MEKCLVTKLQGTVNNDSLLKVGELKIKVLDGTKKLSIVTSASQEISLSKKGASPKFASNSSPSSVIGQSSFTLSANSGCDLYCDTNDSILSISNKYELDSFLSTSGIEPVELSSFLYSDKLARLYSPDVCGNLEALKNLNISYLNIENSQVVGDVANIKNLPIGDGATWNYIALNNCPGIYGNIVDLAGYSFWDTLPQLRVANTAISGNVEDFIALLFDGTKNGVMELLIGNSLIKIKGATDTALYKAHFSATNVYLTRGTSDESIEYYDGTSWHDGSPE